MSYIARQPNGLLIRFSTILDCPTKYNMTEDEYIQMRVESAREEAKELIKNYARPFDEVLEDFSPINMTKEEFIRIIEKCKEEV